MSIHEAIQWWKHPRLNEEANFVFKDDNGEEFCRSKSLSKFDKNVDWQKVLCHNREQLRKTLAITQGAVWVFFGDEIGIIGIDPASPLIYQFTLRN